MSENSSISWTDHTFNIVEGCREVSAGCANCYAKRMVARWGKHHWGDNPRKPMSEAYWRKPLTWDRRAAEGGPNRVFCGSLCDVFEDHPTVAEARERLWALIRATPNLTWMLLTKRPENIAEMVPANWGYWPNVWLGTTVEHAATGWRAFELRGVPAVARFLSCEPLLGPLADVWLEQIHWVICGGESGPGYRPMELDWARGLRSRCRAAGVAFFFKQQAAMEPGTDPYLDGEMIQEFPAQAARPAAKETQHGT
jgi:protein gp37